MQPKILFSFEDDKTDAMTLYRDIETPSASNVSVCSQVAFRDADVLPRSEASELVSFFSFSCL